MLPYISPAAMVYGGISSLLDDQVSEERRPAALVRLRKYAGLEPGYTPITVRAEAMVPRTRENPGTGGAAKSRGRKRSGENRNVPHRHRPACSKNTG